MKEQISIFILFVIIVVITIDDIIVDIEFVTYQYFK